jgi:hypothetical protein
MAMVVSFSGFVEIRAGNKAGFCGIVVDIYLQFLIMICKR